MYKIQSTTCVKAYFSDSFANPSPKNGYSREETGSEISVYWAYDHCSQKKDLHMSIFPCDHHHESSANYTAEEGEPCSI
jgi:hypothetical protein